MSGSLHLGGGGGDGGLLLTGHIVSVCKKRVTEARSSDDIPIFRPRQMYLKNQT
jgi:hypothetical protein